MTTELRLCVHLQNSVKQVLHVSRSKNLIKLLSATLNTITYQIKAPPELIVLTAYLKIRLFEDDCLKTYSNPVQHPKS